MADTKEIIKERLGITEVIGSYIKLQKAGVNFKARCPFHQEKTPSFHISPIRNSFYCFGCGAKGDIFSFVERYEGVDFLGALKILAEKAGVPLVYQSKENKDEREKLFELLEKATEFFESNLEKENAAKEYIVSRGLTSESVKNWRIGYAPAKWSLLSEYLNGEGFKDDLIEKAGLSKKGNHGNYDRFRGRIMFPIFDVSGRVIAFSGRIFDGSLEGEGVTPAKYVNSPETILYQKSKVLYGFDKAKEGIRKWTFSIVVEGQMDLVMSHQAGFTNAVAISGTALTSEQLNLLSRLSKRIVLSLDSDAAGLTAAGKSAALALGDGFDVKVADIQGGKDPADIVKENPALLKEIIKNAKHVVEFYLNVLREKNSDIRKFRLDVSAIVLPFVKKIKSPMDRAHFISLVAERLSIPESAIEKELQTLQEDGEGSIKAQIIGKAPSILTRKDLILKSLLGLARSNAKVDEGELKEKIKALVPEDKVENLFSNEALGDEAVFAVEAVEDNKDGPTIDAPELLYHLELEVLKERRDELGIDIKEKEKRQDEGGLNESMKSYQELSKKINKVEESIRSNNFQN